MPAHAGYALNFYKTRSDLARASSERSRQEVFGLWPQFSLGRRVADRNVVVHHDLSALRAHHDDHSHGHPHDHSHDHSHNHSHGQPAHAHEVAAHH